MSETHGTPTKDLYMVLINSAVSQSLNCATFQCVNLLGLVVALPRMRLMLVRELSANVEKKQPSNLPLKLKAIVSKIKYDE